MIPADETVFDLIDRAAAQGNQGINDDIVSSGGDYIPSLDGVNTPRDALVQHLRSEGWTGATAYLFRRFAEIAETFAHSNWTLTSEVQGIVETLRDSEIPELTAGLDRSTLPGVGLVQDAAGVAGEAYDSAKKFLADAKAQAEKLGAALKWIFYGAVALALVIIVHRATSWVPKKGGDT
jgi:hypothetical protein